MTNFFACEYSELENKINKIDNKMFIKSSYLKKYHLASSQIMMPIWVICIPIITSRAICIHISKIIPSHTNKDDPMYDSMCYVGLCIECTMCNAISNVLNINKINIKYRHIYYQNILNSVLYILRKISFALKVIKS